MKSLFKTLLILICLCIASPALLAAVWQTGPGFPYAAPSAVAGLTGNGDTVDIAAGDYIGDCAAWTSDNLLLRAAGGPVHLEAAGNYVWGKGIWVCAGNNIRVEGIEFSGACVPDHNGAGIRLDGSGLTVRNCYFHDNENGILGGNSGVIRIENSEFGYNGYGDGYSHNIYINHADSLIIQYCYFHHAKIGHEIKSRAHVNIIRYNRISNEESGTASREIDLPNGGFAFICGNLIQQGPNAENGTMLGYGLEGMSNTGPHHIILVNNSFVDQRHFNGIFLDIADSTGLLKMVNNIFAGGPAVVLNGSPPNVYTAGNVNFPDENTAGFTDLLNYDYTLLPSSPAIDIGTNPGTAGNIALSPLWQYQHPLQSVVRPLVPPLDAGAYEYDPGIGLSEIRNGESPVSIENTGNRNYMIRWKEQDFKVLQLIDAGGKLLTEYPLENQHTFALNLQSQPHQTLFIRLSGEKKQYIIKVTTF